MSAFRIRQSDPRAAERWPFSHSVDPKEKTMELIDNTGSGFVSHGPCDVCGSSDANAEYTDTSTYCFSCLSYGHGDGEIKHTPSATKSKIPLLQGDYLELRSRQITENTLLFLCPMAASLLKSTSSRTWIISTNTMRLS